MRKIRMTVATLCAAVMTGVVPSVTLGWVDPPGEVGQQADGSAGAVEVQPAESGPSIRAWNEVDDVRVATGAYHSLEAALEAGFVPFDLEGGDNATCFDSEDGGMGVHYVRNIDDTVSTTDPEAMVYELTPDGGTRLVGVEYIVPQEFVEDAEGNVASLPSVLGHDLHKHSFLPVYVLHAWVWDENPDGMYADFNPNVSGCLTA
jgi:hypothetical protein